MKNASLFALVILFLMSCSHKNTEPQCLQNGDTDKAYAMIQGKWNWVKTSAQFRGQAEPSIQTPETEKRREIYAFRSDRTYELRVNNTVTEKGNYKFIKSTTSEMQLRLYSDQNVISDKFITLCRHQFLVRVSPNATSTYSRTGWAP